MHIVRAQSSPCHKVQAQLLVSGSMFAYLSSCPTVKAATPLTQGPGVQVNSSWTSFAYVCDGEGSFHGQPASREQTIVFGSGDQVFLVWLLY